MEVVHITQTGNLKSILSSKIYRNKPILKIYNEIMGSYYGDEYNIDKGLVFAFDECVSNRDKFIKDFVYWKMWGEPRNKFLDKFDDYELIKYQEIGANFFSNFNIKEDQFSILLLDVAYEDLFSMYLHAQTHDMSAYWSDMDLRYEHDNKPLVLLNYDIENIKIKKIIGTAVGRVEKNKINVSLNLRGKYER